MKMKTIYMFITVMLFSVGFLVGGCSTSKLPKINDIDSLITYTILIKSGNIKDSSLNIDKPDTVWVDPGTKVRWEIKAGSNIKHFLIFPKKIVSDQIFDTDHYPTKIFSKLSAGIISKTAIFPQIFKYDIYWTEEEKRPFVHIYKFDPKLAINP